jgi:D-tyrosyl-tRNA(Tyr) deacylase
MRAVVERVTRASVRVGEEKVGAIERGLVALVGVAEGDTEADARILAGKVVGLRIFEDEAGKMNLDLPAAGGALLAISQFTLLGDLREGRRPSFTAAMAPDPARELFERFVALCADRGITVAAGRFGADMAVELVNDGPVTILLDTKGSF